MSLSVVLAVILTGYAPSGIPRSLLVLETHCIAYKEARLAVVVLWLLVVMVAVLLLVVEVAPSAMETPVVVELLLVVVVAAFHLHMTW